MKKLVVQALMLACGILAGVIGVNNDTYLIVSQVWLVGSIIVGEIK